MIMSVKHNYICLFCNVNTIEKLNDICSECFEEVRAKCEYFEEIRAQDAYDFWQAEQIDILREKQSSQLQEND